MHLAILVPNFVSNTLATYCKCKLKNPKFQSPIILVGNKKKEEIHLANEKVHYTPCLRKHELEEYHVDSISTNTNINSPHILLHHISKLVS